jgi:predicted CXXCH cytochrome family protein
VPLEWAFGAGEQAVTFVSRVDKNWYVEHYFSYYPLLSRMGVTPGQQDLQARTLPEAVGRMYEALDANEGMAGCFQCHSTGSVETSGDALQPHETGVRCEACHGAGSTHARAGDPKLIRNPKRMSAVELNQLCGECHRAPAAPGTKIDWNYSWNVRHQPVYLSESACFLKSKGALSCLSCHQPHQALERNVASYNQVCGSCHAAAHTDKAMTNCIDCHMPRVSPQPGLRFTNHWIGIYRDGSRLKPVRR